MKKIMTIALFITFIIILGGCMDRRKQLRNELGSEQEMADKVMEEISLALDNKDSDAIKEMFSLQARENTTELQQQILDLISFYKGKMTSYEGHISSSNVREKGANVSKYIQGMYRLCTEKENYQVHFEYRPISEDKPDEIGMNSLELVTEETYQKAVDSEGSYKWQGSPDESGVYMKE